MANLSTSTQGVSFTSSFTLPSTSNISSTSANLNQSTISITSTSGFNQSTGGSTQSSLIDTYLETDVANAITKDVYPILVIIGLFLNCLVIATLKKRAGRPPLINFFLLVLAVVDNINLVLTTLGTWVIVLTDYKWNIYEKACSVYLVFWFSIGYMSAFMLATLSLDRCMHVYFSMQAKKLATMKTAWMTLFVCIVISFFVINFQFLFTLDNVIHGVQHQYLCPAKPGQETWIYDVVPYLFDQLLYFVVPGIVVVTCNIAIVVKMKLHQKRMKETGIQSKSKSGIESEAAMKRSNKMLFLLSGYYIVAMLPYLIVQGNYNIWLESYSPHAMARVDLVYAILTLIHTSNYCFNFFFYYYASSIFRRDFKQLFSVCRKHGGPTGESSVREVTDDNNTARGEDGRDDSVIVLEEN